MNMSKWSNSFFLTVLGVSCYSGLYMMFFSTTYPPEITLLWFVNQNTFLVLWCIGVKSVLAVIWRKRILLWPYLTFWVTLRTFLFLLAKYFLCEIYILVITVLDYVTPVPIIYWLMNGDYYSYGYVCLLIRKRKQNIYDICNINNMVKPFDNFKMTFWP